jgi:hypothetical protein
VVLLLLLQHGQLLRSRLLLLLLQVQAANARSGACSDATQAPKS